MSRAPIPWIPVSRRLPLTGGTVPVTIAWGKNPVQVGTAVGRLYLDGWLCLDRNHEWEPPELWHARVIAWLDVTAAYRPTEAEISKLNAYFKAKGLER
jgi:hypothetical protein